MTNQNLESALRNLSDQTGDVAILFMFTIGLLVILILIWMGFKHNEEQYQTRTNIEKVENYLTKGVIYNLPRDLGNGFTEYDIENLIFVQDDVQQYSNRYDLRLIRTSDEESEGENNLDDEFIIHSAESYETIV